MPMILKVDADGHVVVVDGKPVYVGEDEKDIEVDVPVLFQKVRDLNAESKQHRERAEALDTKYEVFKDVEDLQEYKKAAEEAVEKVKSFSEKDLVEAGKVDEIKREMKAAHDAALDSVETAHGEAKTAYEATIKGKDEVIYNLMVSSKFAQSSYFSGEKPKTNLQPEIAEAYFGKHFRVIGDDNGSGLKVVTYLNDKEVFSRKNPGELADFEEGLEAVIDAYPKKNQILRPGKSGSGAQGGAGDQEGDKTGLRELEEQYKVASDPIKGDPRQAIVLKNRLFELRKQQQT